MTQNTSHGLLAFVLALVSSAVFASPSGLVVSQVYGGGGNSGASLRNDFIEVFNAGSAPVSITGFSVQYASASGTSWQVTPLSGTLQAGQYYLIKEAAGAGGTVDLPTADATGSINMSATAGKVALVGSTTALVGAAPTGALDLVSFGAATSTEGTPVAALSNTNGAARNGQGCTDTDDNAADFTVGTPGARNTGAALHVCGANAPIVTACTPFTVLAGSGGSGLEKASDVDSTVNAATLTTQTAGITLGSVTPASGPGNAATAQVLVAASVPAGTYAFVLNWSNDQAQTAMCTSSVTAGALTRIFTIQGSGTSSPLVGHAVITQGAVTRVNNNGFYMQDPTGDGDDGTSDGIFVFTSTAPTVNVGDLTRVSATVSEFNTGLAGNTDTASHTVTELSSVTAVAVVGSGYAITPVPVSFPLANRDDLEKYEGMLVTLSGPLTVAQNFYDGRFGQLTLAAQGPVETPTNRLRPGSAALALYADNKRRSIVLEDGTTVQDPDPTPFFAADHTVRAGDTVPSITGVIDYGLATDSSADPGSWRIVPTVAPVFTRANPRTTAPDDVGGTIRIGSANVDNFFTTFTNGQTAGGLTGQGCTVGTSTSASNCRGADSLAEFLRQRAKIVAEIVGMNADVVGLMEIQNNGTTAIQNLVDAVNAALGSTQYVAVPDPAQGTGTDAIKIAMIYRPAKLTRSGASISDPNPIHNRPPLAQTFAVPGGQTFTLVANHLRSKGCGGGTGLDADQGDLQGCFNATRVQQVRATRAFVASLFPSGPLPNVILVGDFNAYAKEDPIADATDNGYVDELGRFNTFGYSYQFDGSSGRLDQALTSAVMSSKVKRAVEWHVNADEPSILDYNLEFKQPACATCSPDYYTPTPYRASDHDPIVIGVSFGTAAPPKTK